MLLSLQIENYALIRSLNIQFDEGFTAITGETGAGKSILLGALSLILGSRADTSTLYNPNNKCIVEGLFNIDNLALQPFFDANDLDFAAITTLRREISPNGKSRAFINDTPVTLTVLKELSSLLIDIHSQHQNLLFNNADFRLSIIDQFAHNQPLLANYHNNLNHLHQLEQVYNQLLENKNKTEATKDYLEFVVHELQTAKLQLHEQEDTEQQINLLSNAELIKTKLFSTKQILDEQEINAIHLLSEAQHSLADIAHLNPTYEKLSQRIESTILELKDITFDLHKLENEIDLNPELLLQLTNRLDVILTLQQKHHLNSIEELLQLLDDMENRLNSISINAQQLEEVKLQKEEQQKKTTDLAQTISQRRKEVIPTLEEEIKNQIKLLNMADGELHIELSPCNALTHNGIDKADILFSANKGGIPLEIEKVASGGELSRLMLAIKSIITDATLLPTVIFDEIDTGISGDIAGKVAELMKMLSSKHQLLVITHLPQIAATAKLHYYVYKEVIDNKTYTNIRLLNQKEREIEIAKMIGGTRITDNTIKTAQELLESSFKLS